jgi:hypothetical protein
MLILICIETYIETLIITSIETSIGTLIITSLIMFHIVNHRIGFSRGKYFPLYIWWT